MEGMIRVETLEAIAGVIIFSLAYSGMVAAGYLCVVALLRRTPLRKITQSLLGEMLVLITVALAIGAMIMVSALYGVW